MKKKQDRFCLKRDEDSHWYLVPVKQAKAFDRECEKAYATDEHDNFEKQFGNMRIDGYHRITFTDPATD